jgi:hypothetical protein
MPYLLGYQKPKSTAKNQQGRQPAVVPEAMAEGRGADQEGKGDHRAFKCRIVYDIDPQNGQGGDDQGQYRTMDGAGQGGENAKRIPVY